MTCKGVYASLGFSIYITKDKLIDLLLTGKTAGPAYIGKVKLDGGNVKIYLDKEIAWKLSKAYNQDKAAIEQAKASMASGYFKSVNKIGKP